MQASNKQKHQNVSVSLFIKTEISSEAVETAMATVRKCAGPSMLMKLLVAVSEDPRLKAIDPSIMAAMNVAKMSPNGIEDCSPADGLEKACADLSAADQKKTKRYMEPSKTQHTKPKIRIRLSAVVSEYVHIDLRDLGQTFEYDL